MNKIFRIVFNRTTGRWTVASEVARGRTKASASRVAATTLLFAGALGVTAGASAGEPNSYISGVISSASSTCISSTSPGALSTNTTACDSGGGSAQAAMISYDASGNWGAYVTGVNGVALGQGSIADRTNTVSVGAAGTERQIVNVGAGTENTDAVNVSQLKTVVTALGGGAAFDTATGAVTAPSYSVGTTTGIATVGDAVDALDDRIDGVAANPISFAGNSGANVARKLGETLAIKGVASTVGTYSGNNLQTVSHISFGAAFSGQDQSVGIGFGRSL